MSRPINPYKLEGLRSILALAPSAVTIQHQIDALEAAIDNGSAMAFDLADGLVGSICKTIMADRSHPCDGSWVTVKLFNLPPGREYNQLLARAAFVHMLFGVLLTIGLSLG